MQKVDRSTKLLLAMIVLGLWAGLLKGLLLDHPQAATAQARRQYAVCAIDKQGNFNIGGDGTIALSGTGLQIAMDEIPRRGWRIHTVVSPPVGGYVVVVEK